MKCLIISQEFPPGPGGLGTHAYEVARHLAGRGWTVSVVTNQDYATDEEIATFNAAQPFSVRRIRRLQVPLVSLAARWRATRREIARFRPDIVMATGDRAVYVAADLARKRRVRWVAIEHGTVPHGMERRIKLRAYASADALVCVSNYTWSQAEKMGVRPRRLVIIPNGADSARFHPFSDDEKEAARRDLGFEGKRILLTVGSVSRRKGQDVVIRALPTILAEVHDSVYLCAGVKLDADEFTTLASELRVAERVRFLGPVSNEEIVRLMNAADIFLMTSRHTGGEFEGYGIAAVEAALCSTPSVVTRDSGLAEAILDGVTGFAVPQNDPDAVARAALRLLKDEGLRRKMGESARFRAALEQTWEKRVAHYDQLFRSIIGHS